VTPRPEPHPESAYALRDLAAVAEAFHRSRHGGWLAIARGLAEALDVPCPVDPACRPEAVPRRLPPATVFLLAATETDPPGCIGHVAARPGTWTVGSSGAGESSATIAGGSDLVERVTDAVVDSVRTLSPDAVRPESEVVIPFSGEGDSHAVAVAIAVMHALLRGRVPAGLAATGGFDAETGRFRPVPVATLSAKLAAARRWGIRTLVVVEGQAFPDGGLDQVSDRFSDQPAAQCSGHAADPPGGSEISEISETSETSEISEIIEISDDPGALPMLVLQLAADTAGAEVAVDGMVEAWRQALGLYDLRVATRLNEPVDSVLAVTRAFVEPVASRLDPTRPAPPSDVRAATTASGMDPIIVGLAADIRSRALLHAGRTVESAWWDAIALGLRGLGDLPDGMLGDHLVFRQPSHRSIVALDLGDLDDPAPTDDPGRKHPHAALDEAIEELEHRWCTRHQALFAIFASNTRWRRRLYLARRDLDPARLAAAEHDLVRWRLRWEDLLDVHARRALRMGNTDLARQWNAVLEHAVSEVAIADSEGFGRGGGDPAIRRRIAARWIRDDGLRRDLDARLADVGVRSAFDLRGLLQWLWLTGDRGSVPAAVIDRCRAVVADATDNAAIGVAEWWWRLSSRESPDAPDACDPALVHTAILRSLEPHLSSAAVTGTPAISTTAATPATTATTDPAPGVHRLLALRRAAMLDLDRVPGAPAASWVDSVVPPDRPGTLRRAFDDLRGRPELLLVRTPY